jgi:hypothetical protein
MIIAIGRARLGWRARSRGAIVLQLRPANVRLAELLVALSLATDLGNRFVPETALGSCLREV